MTRALVIAVLGSAWVWSMASALVAMQRADRAEHAQRAVAEPLPGDGESCCGPTAECEFCEVGR